MDNWASLRALSAYAVGGCAVYTLYRYYRDVKEFGEISAVEPRKNHFLTYLFGNALTIYLGHYGDMSKVGSASLNQFVAQKHAGYGCCCSFRIDTHSGSTYFR